MTFLNPLPTLFWLFLLLPIIIFIINNRTSKTLKFSSIYLLTSLKSNQINRIKILDILLLILRILIILFILLIVMRPHKKDSLSNLNNIGDKIINLIFIDDSFSNLYGSINGINQLTITNDLIDGISESYPVDSRLKIICLNRGLVFDGLNDEVSIDNILEYDYNYVDFQKLLGSEYENYHKNIHIISHLNAHSNKEINNFYDKIKNDSSQFNFFFHALPKISNNQYIKEVRLINDLNQKFSNYEIIIGNNSDKDVEIVLSASKNLYNYDSTLYIDNNIPIYTNTLSVPSNSIIIDTMTIDLDLKQSFELFFELSQYGENKGLALIDDRVEDNYYSYSLNIPNSINISVLYSDIIDKNHISSILDAFKINTESIDSNFYKMDYILTQGLQKYSNISNDKNILLFLGYDVFAKSNNDIISTFLKRKKSHILIFPTKSDIKQKKHSLKLNNSNFVNLFHNKKPTNTYDTVNFNQNFNFSKSIRLNNNFKFFNYFYHSKNENSLLNINYEKSLWSRYKIKNGLVDLFGIFINYGNNLFDDQITYSIPLMYKIIIDEKINSKDNNLIMNKDFKFINNNSDKFKFVNSKNDSIIFFDLSNQRILSKGLFALIVDDAIESLYSFNPNPENFNPQSDKLNFPYTLIDYHNQNNLNSIFANTVKKSDLTKFFIYFLFIFLIIEMLLSNAKPPKSD